MKFGRILDEEGGSFSLEYDNTLGKKLTMRLDAVSYERALREAKSYLGIDAESQDAAGDEWHLE